MRHRLVIIISVALIIGILIALNAANYARPNQEPESELRPNRSTYNAGPTGTRALYDLLSESGFQVTRWRDTLTKLSGKVGAKVGTFVIVGGLQRPISEEDSTSLMQWVEHGGRLVIIDRAPNLRLLAKSGYWTFYTESLNFPQTDIDPANSDQMTAETDAVHPSQPTLLTRGVQSVRPSRYASVIRFKRTPKVEAKAPPKSSEHQNHNDDPSSEDTADSDDEEESGQEGSPPVDKAPATAVSPAPVVHANTSMGALLIDYPHGHGRVIVLCDPYIVSNGGIKLADNLQLALNALTQGNGLIAFDEYHQGHSVSANALAVYFAGTPVLAIFAQFALIVLAMVWTRGRRFGRPLPLPQVDRRSSLEFVASMAELQQRARALDLAIENIYTRTRRVLTRYAGVDYHSSRTEIAERVASRSSLSRQQVETLMRRCEETINGEPINERQAIELVRRLRELESSLGLRLRSREAKQAAEHI